MFEIMKKKGAIVMRMECYLHNTRGQNVLQRGHESHEAACRTSLSGGWVTTATGWVVLGRRGPGGRHRQETPDHGYTVRGNTGSVAIRVGNELSLNYTVPREGRRPLLGNRAFSLLKAPTRIYYLIG